MDHRNTPASEHRRIDFDIHDVVRIRLIDASPGDLRAACALLGSPSKLPLTDPDITIRFVENLSAQGIRFLGADQGFTDDGFFLLQEGTRQAKARIPFDRIGAPCEVVCKSGIGSVPLLMPIVGLTALKKECVPIHASAIVHHGTGILLAGWAHCGKTAALLGFASKGAAYVGEEWVLLSGDGRRMFGLVRPLDLRHRHVASLPDSRRSGSSMNRYASQGISVLHRLQNMILGQRIASNFVFRGLQRMSAIVEDRLRPEVALSAIFGDRICSKGAAVHKILLFISHEECAVDVEVATPFEMACRLSALVQHELTPLLPRYAAYRYAFPRRRNEFLEGAAEYSLAFLARALYGKDTYIVRLPYPHAFSELFEAIQPYCKPTTVSAVKTLQVLA